jgi:hypothetical protein
MTDEAHPRLLRRLQLRAMRAVFRVVNVPMRAVLALPIRTPARQTAHAGLKLGARPAGNTDSPNPMAGRFVPIPKRADGHYDRARLDLAIRHGFCIVRWSPHDSAARETTKHSESRPRRGWRQLVPAAAVGHLQVVLPSAGRAGELPLALEGVVRQGRGEALGEGRIVAPDA